MKKDIVFVVYDMEIGGIERSLINMLESFDYEKFNVDLLVHEHKGEFMNLIPEKVNLLPQEDKYTVFRKPIVQCLREGHLISSSIRLFSKYVANGKAKTRCLEEGAGYIQMQLATKYTTHFLPRLKKRYDVAISYAWPHDFVVNCINANKKIAWVHTDYSKLEIDNAIDLKMWNKFDNIASVSTECMQSFITTYPSLKDKVSMIENITSPSFIKSMAEEQIQLFNRNKDTFNILSVGRLSYVKGFDIAINSLRRLHDKGITNINWYVVGYGGYEAELKKLILENNLEDSFFLLGKKSNPYPFIKACNLYVQPSRYEGKAVTVTEAKILGKPILITNYPTSKSQVEHKVDGIICEGSTEGLAKEIEQLYKNEQIRNSLVCNIKNKDYSNQYELSKLYQLIAN